MIRVLLILLVFFFFSCRDNTKPAFDLQGHRGARGMRPENSIPGFIYAVDQGVSTLEMDLAVTRDNQLIVSHEPYMSSEICKQPSGESIADSAAYLFNIFEMSYEEVRAFDCGLKPHSRFPQQKKMKVSKPLLLGVIDTVDKYCTHKDLKKVNFNIEIKCSPEGDRTFHPVPSDFSDLVYSVVNTKLDWDRVTIQSFDFRVLQYFNQTYPDVSLALLIENDLSYQENFDSLGFYPAIYSPYYKLLTEEIIRELQNLSIKVIPWTVNDTPDMRRLKKWGVDGLITDYPNRLKSE